MGLSIIMGKTSKIHRNIKKILRNKGNKQYQVVNYELYIFIVEKR